MFTIMNTFCVHLHALALRPSLKPPRLVDTRFVFALVGVSLLGTPCMMLAMATCQLLQLRIGPDSQPTQLPGRPDFPSAVAAALRAHSRRARLAPTGRPRRPLPPRRRCATGATP